MKISNEKLEGTVALFGNMEEGSIGRNYAEVSRELLRARELLEEVRNCPEVRMQDVHVYLDNEDFDKIEEELDDPSDPAPKLVAAMEKLRDLQGMEHESTPDE